MTLSLVSTVTVGAGGAASISFTGIPQTATDLYLVVSARQLVGTGGANIIARFNSDSTAGNYAGRYLSGNGATVTSQSAIDSGLYVGRVTGTGQTANTFGSGSAVIANYTSSTSKSVSTDMVDENNATTAGQLIVASSWVGTAAITSITLTTFSANNFDQYSTASLYTITKGSGGASVA